MAKGDNGTAPDLGERIQIGVKMEKRMVKVLKAVAEYHDISLGELLEGIVLHAFDHSLPFDQETIQRITQLKKVYEMDYDIEAAPRMKVSDTTQPKLMR
ncbi:MAG: hypothetical protein H0X24_05095 [Ktedonobacterales bacterium]|nr:hypothetical protein [Ktedonobacterales bacterium]